MPIIAAGLTEIVDLPAGMALTGRGYGHASWGEPAHHKQLPSGSRWTIGPFGKSEIVCVSALATISYELELVLETDHIDKRGLKGAHNAVAAVGNPGVGGVLTAIFERGASGSVQWQRDGVDISGATGLTYTMQAADEGRQITVRTTSIGFVSQGVFVPGAPPPSSLAITGSAPTSGTVGTAYAGDYNASGGTAPYTFSLASGSLPAGTSLNSSTGTISGAPTTAGAFSFAVRVTDSVSATSTAAAVSGTIAASGGGVVVPGAPTGLTLGTATSSTQPLSWTAPASNGGATITDYVVQRATASSGPWTTFSDGTSASTSATVTGLTASTTYYYRIAAVNSAGAGAYSSVASGATAGAGVDTRPRYGVGAANAGQNSPAALLASMTPLTGSSNGGVAGTFTVTSGAGQYPWVAFEASASASGVTFFDGLGNGGWQGADTPSGNNVDDPNVSPCTSTVTYSDGTTTWRFFRTNYADVDGSFTTS